MEWECRYVRLLQSAVDPKQHGNGLYFSYHTNLTLSTERATGIERENVDAMWMMEDTQFFWNMHLTEPLAGSAFP